MGWFSSPPDRRVQQSLDSPEDRCPLCPADCGVRRVSSLLDTPGRRQRTYRKAGCANQLRSVWLKTLLIDENGNKAKIVGVRCIAAVKRSLDRGIC